MASTKDADLVKIISQIKIQVEQVINQNENTRKAVKQQVADLQRQIDGFQSSTNEVLNNNVRVLKSLDEQLVHCSKLLNPSLVSDTEKDTTTDPEICTSPGTSGADSDESYDNSKPVGSNSCSNDNVNIEPNNHSTNDNTPGSEHLQITPELPDSSDVMVEESRLHVKKTLYPPLQQKKHYLTWNRLTLAQKTHEDDDGKLVRSNIGKVEVIDGYGKEKEQFKYPYLLVNGPNNELIVSDRDSHQLIVFDESLQFLHTIGGRGKSLKMEYFTILLVLL